MRPRQAPRASTRPLASTLAIAALLVGLTVSGCGGDDDGGNDAPERAKKTRTATGPPPSPTMLTQGVRVVAPDRSEEYRPTVAAQPTDSVQFATQVDPGVDAARLRIVIDRGPARRLEASAAFAGAAADASRTATITSSAPIRLENLRYVCPVAEPSFCPVEGRSTAAAYELEVGPLREPVPVLLVADIAPG